MEVEHTGKNHSSREVLFSILTTETFVTPSLGLLQLIFDVKQEALKALKSLYIEQLANKKVENLSGGQKQRVAIARAIVTKPSVLLADEPTGALDSKTSLEIIGVIKSLNQQGMTSIIVTHDINVANECRKIVNIEDGKNVDL
ncbi:hypothetical protein AOC36_01175 [Erysipelothrix larvae]|uniref:ABC transporter domain-containing protein n=1 Tax=Erysipelothrix larvae TaxID=1514105 RepID=A0A0X8GYA3_9FIRM|nr:ATP-binding cassette domain-containing protein [Erysipelothrix larvae]AMC92652.1 hypothetical protein AOC36_01175 [Erysipelothrix larvae]